MTKISRSEKLAILADAAKYDASCASSGSVKRNSAKSGGIGSTGGLGICHNNLANLAGQSKEVREQLQLSPEHHFEQAAAPTFSI